MPPEAEPEPDYELSEYERQRQKKIERNNARLVALGLKDKYGGKIDIIRKKKKVVRRQPASPKIKPGEERRSKRLSRDKVKLYELSSDHDDGAITTKEQQDTDYLFEDSDDDDGKDYQGEVIVRQVQRRIKINRDDYSLSKEAIETLQEGKMDETYLGKFREFLRYIGKISEQNERSVMRQVGKLARGEGIRYESPRYGWKQDQYFMKGRKITPLDDIVDLMEKAQECEDKWGPDHGNGWLLSHPLKKLLLFQQFCLNNPSFLTSKCKIKEYVRREEEGDEEEVWEEVVDEQSTKDEEPGDDEKLVSCKDKPKPPSPSKASKTKAKSTSSSAAESKEIKAKSFTKPAASSAPEKKTKKDSKYVGVRISKTFDDGIYFGIIAKYLAEKKFWDVKYDDGDEEEFDINMLRKALRHYKKHGSKDRKKSNNNKKAEGKRSIATSATCTPSTKRRKTRESSSAGTRKSPRTVAGI